MTISSDVSYSGPYNGNGVTTAFPYNFKAYAASHLSVYLIDADTGERELVSPSAYGVSGVGSPSGGNVTFLVAPAIGKRPIIVLVSPFTQETDLENQGPYLAETVERRLDLIVQQSLVLKRDIDRAIKADFGSDIDPRLPPYSPGHVLAFDGAEKKLVAAPIAAGDISSAVDAARDYRDAARDYRDAARDYRDAAGEASEAAGTSATAAQERSLEASGRATAAEAAAAAAEAARDAAFGDADVYADTAAGLAATTEGDQFQVVVDDEIIRYRHDAGPAATEVARMATSAIKLKTDPVSVQAAAPDLPVLELLDGDNNSHGVVMSDEMLATYRQSADGSFRLVDAARNIRVDLPPGAQALAATPISDGASFRLTDIEHNVIAQTMPGEQLLSVTPIPDALLRIVDLDNVVYMEVGPNGFGESVTPITHSIYAVWAEPWTDPSKNLAVTWVSSSPTATAVEFGVAAASVWQSAGSARSRAFPGLAGLYLHTALLDGLSPATAYRLRFPGANAERRVRTTPRRDVTVALASDFHATDPASQGRVASFGGLVSNDADLLILNGDHTYEDGVINATTGGLWLAYMNQATDAFRKDGASIPLLLTIGNHEGRNAAGNSNAQSGGDGTAGALPTIASCGYDPDQPSRRNNSAAMIGVGAELAIISLETDHTVPLIDQLDWFEDRLLEAAASYRHIIVVGHVPAFMGSELNLEANTQSRVLRGHFWPAMETYADLIRFYFAGHEHILGVTGRLRMHPTGTVTDPTNDNRFAPDAMLGVRQIGSGPSGGTRLRIDAAKTGQLSAIDGATTKFIAALGYDVTTDAAMVHGPITNASTSTWSMWMAEFHSDGGFEARAINLAGLPLYTISE